MSRSDDERARELARESVGESNDKTSVTQALELVEDLDMATTASSDIRLKRELDLLVFEIRLYEHSDPSYEVRVNCSPDLDDDQYRLRIVHFDDGADDVLLEVDA